MANGNTVEYHKCDGPFTCLDCQKVYKTYGFLKRHVEAKHKAILVSPSRILWPTPIPSYFEKAALVHCYDGTIPLSMLDNQTRRLAINAIDSLVQLVAQMNAKEGPNRGQYRGRYRIWKSERGNHMIDITVYLFGGSGGITDTDTERITLIEVGL